MNEQREARRPGILVVDNDAGVREVLDLGLQAEGFAVWLASDSREALDVYQRYADRIELVLLEVRLPGLDGPKTLAALQQLNPAIRCCFMSGYLGSYTEEELLRLGGALLNKPFGSAEVAPVLWRLLGRIYSGPHRSDMCPSVLSWRNWGTV